MTRWSLGHHIVLLSSVTDEECIGSENRGDKFRYDYYKRQWQMRLFICIKNNSSIGGNPVQKSWSFRLVLEQWPAIHSCWISNCDLSLSANNTSYGKVECTRSKYYGVLWSFWMTRKMSAWYIRAHGNKEKGQGTNIILVKHLPYDKIIMNIQKT